MKRFYSLSLTALMLSTCWLQASAVDFIQNDIAYAVSDDFFHTVEVVALPDDATIEPVDVVIPPTVTFGGITYTVEGVGMSAYENCHTLESVTLPETVGTIFNYAFSGCDRLRNIEMSENLAKIGVEAFFGCSSLESIVIPDGVKIIPPKTFSGCSSLKRVKVGENLMEIGKNAFAGCGSLEKFNFSETLETVDDSAFANCTSLETAYFPKRVVECGKYVFEGCTSLRYVRLPQGMTEIPAGFLKDCASLETVHLPEGLTAIGARAFSNCSSLRWLYIPESVEHISIEAFAGAGLQSFCFGFDNAEIGVRAFAGCDQLKTLSLDGVHSLGEEAFMNCTALETVRLNQSMQSMGVRCFHNCPGLSTIDLWSEYPPVITLTTFDPYTEENCTLNVIEEYIPLYEQNRYWENFRKIGILKEDHSEVEVADLGDSAAYRIEGKMVRIVSDTSLTICRPDGTVFYSGTAAEGEEIRFPDKGLYLIGDGKTTEKIIVR